MIDMEQDLEVPIVRPSMQELSLYLRIKDYTEFSPQAVMMMFALVQQYDPRVRPEGRTQYCQMQFSSLSDGGGTGSVRHRRMITHTGDRIIGHILIDHHFSQTRAEGGIRQTDKMGYPLPFASLDDFMIEERRKREAEKPTDMQKPAQDVSATDQQTHRQTGTTASVTADRVVVETAPTENTTAGDVVEEVAAVTMQKTRRVTTK